MLNADMCIGFNITIDGVSPTSTAPATQRCGPQSGPGGAFGCSAPSNLIKPITYALTNEYAQNTAFYNAFSVSYTKMTTVGYRGFSATATTTTGKLGTLTGIDLSQC